MSGKPRSKAEKHQCASCMILVAIKIFNLPTLSALRTVQCCKSTNSSASACRANGLKRLDVIPGHGSSDASHAGCGDECNSVTQSPECVGHDSSSLLSTMRASILRSTRAPLPRISPQPTRLPRIIVRSYAMPNQTIPPASPISV